MSATSGGVRSGFGSTAFWRTGRERSYGNWQWHFCRLCGGRAWRIRLLSVLDALSCLFIALTILYYIYSYIYISFNMLFNVLWGFVREAFEASFNIVIKACPRWADGLKIFQDLKVTGLLPSIVSYNSALRSCVPRS